MKSTNISPLRELAFSLISRLKTSDLSECQKDQLIKQIDEINEQLSEEREGAIPRTWQSNIKANS